jgi:hypothetical protein
MKSIFHSDKTVVVDGTEYTITADETIGGVKMVKVTSESGESDTCRRSGSEVYLGRLYRSGTDEFEILQVLEEVDGVTVRRDIHN